MAEKKQSLESWKATQPEICSICFAKNIEFPDIIKCAAPLCSVSVHPSCYYRFINNPPSSSSSTKPPPWLCNFCSTSSSLPYTPNCIFCPNAFGPLIQIIPKFQIYAHSLCCAWIFKRKDLFQKTRLKSLEDGTIVFCIDDEDSDDDEIFSDFNLYIDRRYSEDSFKLIDPKYWTSTCCICKSEDDSNFGCKIPCDAHGCKNSMHATCAQSISSLEISDDPDISDPYFIYCKKHSHTQFDSITPYHKWCLKLKSILQLPPVTETNDTTALVANQELVDLNSENPFFRVDFRDVVTRLYAKVKERQDADLLRAKSELVQSWGTEYALDRSLESDNATTNSDSSDDDTAASENNTSSKQLTLVMVEAKETEFQSLVDRCISIHSINGTYPGLAGLDLIAKSKLNNDLALKIGAQTEYISIRSSLDNLSESIRGLLEELQGRETRVEKVEPANNESTVSQPSVKENQSVSSKKSEKAPRNYRKSLLRIEPIVGVCSICHTVSGVGVKNAGEIKTETNPWSDELAPKITSPTTTSFLAMVCNPETTTPPPPSTTSRKSSIVSSDDGNPTKSTNNGMKRKRKVDMFKEENRKNHLIKCDECKKLFHIFCLDPPMLKLPGLGVVWVCEDCDSSDEDEEDGEDVKKEDGGGEKLNGTEVIDVDEKDNDVKVRRSRRVSEPVKRLKF